MKLLKITKASFIFLSMALAWLFSKLIALVLFYFEVEAATAEEYKDDSLHPTLNPDRYYELDNYYNPDNN